MNLNHPYIKYAYALLLSQKEDNVDFKKETLLEALSLQIQNGINNFRVKPTGAFIGKESVDFTGCDEQKGDPSNGVFLSPSILSSDKAAGYIYKAAKSLLAELPINMDKNTCASMSIAPISGEYLTFSKSGAGRGKSKISYIEAALCAITTMTPDKPCLAYKEKSGGKIKRMNIAIIPDLEKEEELIKFILLFNEMKRNNTSSLFKGSVYKEKNKKGEVVKEKPSRPKIYNGNFPNAPSSSALGAVGLLGAIGEFSKRAEMKLEAEAVLESLKETTMYIISYGDAKSFTYNHYIIDLAKEGKLRSIVDSIYYIQLYKGKRRDEPNEYEKLDLFSGRFLQIFNLPAFKDFMSFRGEYPEPLITLLFTYFIKIEMISIEIVQSARALGKWLNLVAYLVAKEEIKQGSPNYWDEIRKVKAKVLIELESSAFSAKTGDALIAQTVARAGRLSKMDVPESAALFMEKANENDPNILNLDQAKNLLIAFSRLQNRFQKKEEPKVEKVDDVDDILSEDIESEDLEDAQV
ncbi:type I-PGING CRISPR-associated protein Cas8c/Csp2 [Arcticibacter eurypsychrophilus]|uniref:type I-PGING CRISPR-associated protein Cas8c/Csp2 n=1 Tax=Arcticibacter eurypsychrophilus TaxID=1434752 RepID=UPI00084CF6F8|nr:type I-PGING CRISPR-associated protein Cas8c/Csp2 [Arcticibacter eurypsychrophilus]